MDLTEILRNIEGYTHALPSAVTHAASLGGDDYLGAAVSSDPRPYMDRVHEAHEKRADQEKEFPISSTVGSLIGSLLNTPKALASAGGKPALINAGMGTLQGGLDSEGDPGTAATQGAISAALPFGLSRVGKLGIPTKLDGLMERIFGREAAAREATEAAGPGPLSHLIDSGEYPADRAARLAREATEAEQASGANVVPLKPQDKVGDIVRLNADREASDAGEHAAGSPSRSFSEIAKDADSDTSNVHAFTPKPGRFAPIPPSKSLVPVPDPGPELYEPHFRLADRQPPDAWSDENIANYMKQPFAMPGRTASETNRAMIDALTGQARSASRWAGTEIGVPQADAAPTKYDKSHPIGQYDPIPGSDVDATQAVDDYKRRQVPLPEGLTRDSYKKFEFPLPDDITVDSYKKYEAPPLRDDLKYDDYKKYLDPQP